MNKKFTVCLCTLALLCSSFAGCGASETSSTPADSAPNETAVSATQAAAPAASEVEAQADSAVPEEAAKPEGNPFSIVLPGMDTAELDFSNVYTLPLSEDGDTLTVMHEALNLMGPLANVGLNSFQEMDYIQEIQSRTGITLEIRELPHETKDEQMQLTIASGDLPDMFCGLNYSTGDEGALADEIIVDLTEYADFAPNYFYMISSNPDQKNAFLSDGKVLKFFAPYEQYRANQGLVVRKDWLEEQGLDVPETYDQLTETLEAFQSAYGCSTPIYMNKQCYITGLSDGFNITAFPADGGVETVMPYYVEDGTVKSTLNSDGFRDYLKLLNQWYQKGFIDPDFSSIEYNPFSDYLSNQITSDQMGVWCTSGEGIDNYTVPVTCMPMPVQNEGDMDHIFTTSLTADSQNDTYITTGCEDLELCMQYMDYWYSLDGIVFANYGVEGVSYEIGDNQEPEFTDVIVNNEYGISVSNMMRLYCAYGVWNAPMLRMRTASYNSDLANEAWEVWSSKLDGTMTMPDYISLNTDQAEQEGYHSSDILTYALQMVPQFILGTADLDSQWDEYCAQLDAMGLADCVAVWQEAYDTVMN